MQFRFLLLVNRILIAAMSGVYIETIPNRTSPPAILLREGFRENGKVVRRTSSPERFAHLLGSSWLRCP